MAPKAKPSRTAGPELHRGIGREGRSKTYKRRGLWAIKKKNGGKFPVTEKKDKAAEPASKVRLRNIMQVLYPLTDKLWQCIDAATASIDMQHHVGQSSMMLLVPYYDEVQSPRPVSVLFPWHELLQDL